MDKQKTIGQKIAGRCDCDAYLRDNMDEMLPCNACKIDNAITAERRRFLEIVDRFQADIHPAAILGMKREIGE